MLGLNLVGTKFKTNPIMNIRYLTKTTLAIIRNDQSPHSTRFQTISNHMRVQMVGGDGTGGRPVMIVFSYSIAPY